ncbi:MAG: diguanylate cyclase domain-containing protein [Solirubrobacteraceae bacterium]
MEDELRLRTRMIDAGIWLSVVLLAAVSGWIAATWGRPHRGGLTAMVAGAALATVIVALLPHERIVAGRFREPFFLTWSLALVGFITVAADLDAGVRSPVVLMLFLTLVYAALSYPRWLVGVVSVVSLVAVLILSQAVDPRGGPPTDPVYLGGLMLTLAVTGVMCICQARIQEQARSELGRLSRCDHLTGCLNRLGFAERLTAELSRVKRTGGGLALVVLDFDDFKAINDGQGHSAGDELLCWATQAMAGALRPADGLGRLGGDEFAALLVDADAERGSHVADRLRLALSERISASVGVACSRDDGLSADLLYHCADERLYAAKRGRLAAPDEQALAG